VSATVSSTAAEAFDDFIKLEWQRIFRTEVHVTLDSGTRYVPNAGAQGVQLLRKNVNAFDEAIKIWSGPTDVPESRMKGYDRIVDQAGIEYTWEWFLIDPSREWASAVPDLVRERIRADLARRDRDALARADRLAATEDDALLASMDARRTEQGKAQLTEQQKLSVRQSRRERRTTRF
jgi:hypothetical protein